MTQWYSIDPEHGVEVWATEAEAKAAAEAALEHYRDNASDGWHEQMEALEWGMLLPHGHAKEVDRVERENDDTGLCERIGCDYRCDYVLEDCAQESLAEVLSERSEKREKTLVEVFGFDKLTDEQKKENLLVNLGIAK
jgi:hypothetical protein